jgi:O-antigen/teichoic acid export membrane protein
MNQGKRIVLNAAWNLTSLFVQMATQLILAPLLLIHLGSQGYGLWASTGNLFSYTRLLSAGMNSGVNNWVPKLLVTKDSEGLNRVVNTTLFFYLMMMGLGSVLYALTVWKFPEWANVPVELASTSRVVVAIVGAALLVYIPLNVFGAVLTGMQRYDFHSGTELSGNIFRLVGTLVLVGFNLGIVAVAIVHAVGQLIKNVSQLILAVLKGPKVSFGVRFADWRTFQEMFAYSMNTLLHLTGVIIQTQGAVTLTTFLISSQMAGVFDIPNKIVLLMSQVVAVSVQSLKPAASKLQEERRPEALRELFFLGTKYSVMVSTPMLVLFITYGDVILGQWLGSGYRAEMAILLTIMVVPMTFRLWSDAAFFIVAGMGRHRAFGLITVVSAGLSVLLSCVLVVMFDGGVVGIAYGFAIPIGLISGLVLPLYCCRVMEVSFVSFVRRSVLRGLGAATPFIVVTIGSRYLGLIPESRLSLVVMIAMLSIPGVLGAWFLGFSAGERSRFRGYLPKWIKRRELREGGESGTNEEGESRQDGGVD